MVKRTHILGRLTGQAFIEFADADSLNLGLSKNREHMGKRYLEVNRSSKDEMQKFTEKSNTVSSMSADNKPKYLYQQPPAWPSPAKSTLKYPWYIILLSHDKTDKNCWTMSKQVTL